ncbi:unnamed protein product [Vicia faba]|uniref:Uncharacterized protein n=1 Tax=Vicia faba TaxID=3906 RepID=A0AAV0YW05_VICFA|nr:unnamed protein product [Vicia faba]
MKTFGNFISFAPFSSHKFTYHCSSFFFKHRLNNYSKVRASFKPSSLTNTMHQTGLQLQITLEKRILRKWKVLQYLFSRDLSERKKWLDIKNFPLHPENETIHMHFWFLVALLVLGWCDIPVVVTKEAMKILN